MIRNDVGLGLNGGLAYVKFTLTYSDLSTAGLSQSINLQQNPIPGGAVAITPAVNFQIPQGGVLLGVRIHHTTAFSGGAITAMTVSVGKSGSNAFFASAFDVFQAVGDTTLQETSLFKAGGINAVPVTATFTSIGANVNAATAGSVDIYLCLLNVSQSSGPSTTPGQAGLSSGSGV